MHIPAPPAFVPHNQRADPAVIRDHLRPWIDDLAARIDPADESRLFAEWATFAEGCWPQPVFAPAARTPHPSSLDWPTVHINDAVRDPALMALRQLRLCSDQLARGGSRLLCVRCDYGTPILASVFGVQARLSEWSMDTLPGCLPLGTGAVRALAAAKAPDAASAGLMPLVLAMGAVLRTVLASRPGLAHVHLYHPDLQGPLDTLEHVWGSDCFLHYVDEPELAEAALTAIVDAYLTAWHAWCAVQPPREDGLAVHWGLLHRGRVMLRDDSAVSLSPALARRLVAPYDGRILAATGGGAIHSCGKADHWLPAIAGLPGLHAVNLSQPEMNDPVKVWQSTVARGVQLTPLSAAELDRARAAGLDPAGRVAVLA